MKKLIMVAVVAFIAGGVATFFMLPHTPFALELPSSKANFCPQVCYMALNRCLNGGGQNCQPEYTSCMDGCGSGVLKELE